MCVHILIHPTSALTDTVTNTTLHTDLAYRISIVMRPLYDDATYLSCVDYACCVLLTGSAVIGENLKVC